MEKKFLAKKLIMSFERGEKSKNFGSARFFFDPPGGGFPLPNWVSFKSIKINSIISANIESFMVAFHSGSPPLQDRMICRSIPPQGGRGRVINVRSFSFPFLSNLRHENLIFLAPIVFLESFSTR